MRYILMHKNDPQTEAGERPPPELIAKMGAFIGEYAQRGVFLDGAGLGASATRTRLTFREGRSSRLAPRPSPTRGPRSNGAGVSVGGPTSDREVLAAIRGADLVRGRVGFRRPAAAASWGDNRRRAQQRERPISVDIATPPAPPGAGQPRPVRGGRRRRRTPVSRRPGRRRRARSWSVPRRPTSSPSVSPTWPACSGPVGSAAADVVAVSELLADSVDAGKLGRGRFRLRSSHLPASAPTPTAARKNSPRVSRLSVRSGN